MPLIGDVGNVAIARLSDPGCAPYLYITLTDELGAECGCNFA
jgi:hypothetical protein